MKNNSSSGIRSNDQSTRIVASLRLRTKHFLKTEKWGSMENPELMRWNTLLSDQKKKTKKVMLNPDEGMLVLFPNMKDQILSRKLYVVSFQQVQTIQIASSKSWQGNEELEMILRFRASLLKYTMQTSFN